MAPGTLKCSHAARLGEKSEEELNNLYVNVFTLLVLTGNQTTSGLTVFSTGMETIHDVSIDGSQNTKTLSNQFPRSEF